MKYCMSLLGMTFLLLFFAVLNPQAENGPDAPPELPFSPYGSVTASGTNVPPSSIVHALCAGQEFAAVKVKDFNGVTVYSMNVPGDDPGTQDKEGCVVGETVDFMIDARIANETAVWIAETVEVNLTVDLPVRKVFLAMLRR